MKAKIDLNPLRRPARLNHNRHSSGTGQWLIKWLSGVALLGLLAQTASAQNGTWTNIASGNWSAAINWQSGIVATGVDNTATFNAPQNINTITLDEPLTIGNLAFTTTNYYLVGTNTLTLATDTGIPPNISVETNTTIIGLPLSSSQMVTITNAYGGHGSYTWALTNQANNFAGGLTLQGSQGTFFTTNPTSVLSLGGGSGTIYIGQSVGAGQIGFNVSATNVANSLTNADGSPSIIIPNNFVNQSIRWIFDPKRALGRQCPAGKHHRQCAFEFRHCQRPRLCLGTAAHHFGHSQRWLDLRPDFWRALQHHDAVQSEQHFYGRHHL